jgi:hypothetical protein
MHLRNIKGCRTDLGNGSLYMRCKAFLAAAAK